MRNALWVAGLVLIAGAVAVAVVRLGASDSKPKPAGQAVREPAAAAETAPPTQTLERTVPVAEEARVAAGQFILWAVSTKAKRADLARAWELVHPELKSECACTRAEWLTGNIPVQPYPVADLETATFAVNESYADHVVLEVALLPREGAGVESQFFFIGLKAVPAGGKKRWLVYYWAPRQGAEQGVHIAPESG